MYDVCVAVVYTRCTDIHSLVKLLMSQLSFLSARYHFGFGVSGEAYQIQAGFIWWTSWTANVSLLQRSFS